MRQRVFRIDGRLREDPREGLGDSTGPQRPGRREPAGAVRRLRREKVSEARIRGSEPQSQDATRWPGRATADTRLVRARAEGSYLVDPASSHMLVSKIKPCMSKYKLLIL